jgi:hypothetical protein
MTNEQQTITTKPNDEHHLQPCPNEHLCTCGRYRKTCVRESVRKMWKIAPD